MALFEPDPPPSHFVLNFPLWVMSDPAASRARGHYHFHMLKNPDTGESYLPVFTTDDLARKAIRELDNPHLLPLAAKTLSGFRQLLEQLHQSGVKCVAVDLDVPTKSMTMFTVKELLDRIRQMDAS